jgi:hypothetical protein
MVSMSCVVAKELSEKQVDGVILVMTAYTKPYTPRENSRVFDVKFRGWPQEPPPALLDLVHWACERINPTGGFFAYQSLPKALFTVAAERLRRDAIAHRYHLGVLQRGAFVPVDPRLLLAGDAWLQVFADGRDADGHNLHVLDREMDGYVPALSRTQ